MRVDVAFFHIVKRSEIGRLDILIEVGLNAKNREDDMQYIYIYIGIGT